MQIIDASLVDIRELFARYTILPTELPIDGNIYNCYI